MKLQNLYFVILSGCMARLAMAKAKIPSTFARKLEFEVNANGGCGDVRWTADLSARDITFSIKAGTPDADWVGLGISENGGMKGADIVTIRQTENGDFVIEDRISAAYDKPRLDVLQNAELLHAERLDDGTMHVVFRRLLDTCDNDDLRITPYKTYIICASGFLDEEGDIGYHGPHLRSIGNANLLQNEDILFGKPPSFGSAINLTRIEHALGVASWSDPTAKTSQYPIDIQIPPVTPDSSTITNYRCAVIDIPVDDLRVVAYESVWGDGSEANQGIPPPPYLHHQTLYKVDNTLVEDYPSALNGEPYDCFDFMPSGETLFTHAQNGMIQLPPGVHVPLKRGKYVLLVHYENPELIPIQDDTSGLRFWVEPAGVQSLTEEGQVLVIEGNFDALVIPPGDKDDAVELEYMISSAATQALLPADGVQVFGYSVHMHQQGLRYKVQHLRDGEFLSNIAESMSYDYQRQSPGIVFAELLPGDAVIVSCVYERDPEREVTGGFMAREEMCTFGVGIAPAVPGLGMGVGYFVPAGAPFRNSYLGQAKEVNAYELSYDEALYPPDVVTRPRKSSNNFCELVVRDEYKIPKVWVTDPSIYAQLVLLGALVFCTLSSRFLKVIRQMECMRKRRNTVVYLGEFFVATAGLPIIIHALVKLSPGKESFDVSGDPDTFEVVRGFIVAQSLLYLAELFYRIDVRWDVMAHHLSTIFLVLFINFVGGQTYAVHLLVRLGSCLILMAATDQPKDVCLFLKNIGYADRPWWPKLTIGAAVFYLLSRIVLIIYTFIVLVDGSNGNDASWLVGKQSFAHWANEASSKDYESMILVLVSVTVSFLFVTQIYLGVVLLRVGQKYYKLQKLETNKKPKIGRGSEVVPVEHCFDEESQP